MNTIPVTFCEVPGAVKLMASVCGGVHFAPVHCDCSQTGHGVRFKQGRHQLDVSVLLCMCDCVNRLQNAKDRCVWQGKEGRKKE